MSQTLLELQEALRNLPMSSVQKVAKGAHRQVPQWMGMDEIKRRRDNTESAAGEAAEKEMRQRPMIEEYLEQSAGVMGPGGGGMSSASPGQSMLSGMPQQSSGPPMPPQAAGPPMPPQAAGPPQIPGYADGGPIGMGDEIASGIDWRNIPGMVSREHLIAHQRGYSGEGDWRFKGILPKAPGNRKRFRGGIPGLPDAGTGLSGLLSGATGVPGYHEGGGVAHSHPELDPSKWNFEVFDDRGGPRTSPHLNTSEKLRKFPHLMARPSLRKIRMELGMERALKELEPGPWRGGPEAEVRRRGGDWWNPAWTSPGTKHIEEFNTGGRVGGLPTLGYANGGQPVSAAELQRIIDRLTSLREAGKWISRDQGMGSSALPAGAGQYIYRPSGSEDLARYREDITSRLGSVLPKGYDDWFGAPDIPSYLTGLVAQAEAGDPSALETIRLIQSYSGTPEISEYMHGPIAQERRAEEALALGMQSPLGVAQAKQAEADAKAEKLQRIFKHDQATPGTPATARAARTPQAADTGYIPDNVKRLQEDLLRLEGQIPTKREDMIQALAMAGATTMAGESPYAMTNIGQGLQAGVAGYSDLRNKRQEQLQTVTGTRANLEEVGEIAKARREATRQRASAAAMRGRGSRSDDTYLSFEDWFELFGHEFGTGHAARMAARRQWVLEKAQAGAMYGGGQSGSGPRYIGSMDAAGNLNS